MTSKANALAIVTDNDIKSRIYTIRGVQVMLDEDLAELYDVSTKRLNEQIRRNTKRFPSHYMFVLTKEEYAGRVCLDQFLGSVKIDSVHGIGIG
jgi:hypothetical protein